MVKNWIKEFTRTLINKFGVSTVSGHVVFWSFTVPLQIFLFMVAAMFPITLTAMAIISTLILFVQGLVLAFYVLLILIYSVIGLHKFIGDIIHDNI